VHALTDVTGFGLIGHAREMALASNVSLRMTATKVPLLPGALECVRAGYVPGGLNANREFAECVMGWEVALPEELKTILFDPQTAGGLLIAVAREQTDELRQALDAAGVNAVEIGEVLAKEKPLIRIS
jgi:selenide,water dikinase